MLVLKNASLIDGTGKEPAANSTIMIENGLFREVGTGLTVPSDAVVVDLAGKTVIPGLIDAHTHIGGSSRLDRPGSSHRVPSYDYVEMREGCLRWGVVAVRTCGQFLDETLAFREGVRTGAIERSPRVSMSGRMFQAPGGHPCYTVYMGDPEVEQLACAVVTDDTEIEPFLKESVEKGVDFTKIFYAHLNKMDYPNPVPRISKQKLKEIIDGSHQYGLPVSVHVDSPAEMADAVLCGADVIEHIIGAGETETELSEELLALTKKSGAVIDPTMISIKRFDPLNEAAPSVYEAVKKAVKMCYDAGIPMVVGCDSGIPFVPFGEAVHDEMACLCEAGIPPLEVLTMATRGNAELLNMADRIGTIEPGKEADLIVLTNDPLADIRNTKTIELVLSRGKVMYQAVSE